MQYTIECPDKDFDLILTEYKEVTLTKGKVTLVDEEDYEYINQWKWCVNGKKDSFCAVRSKEGKTVYMSRKIMKCPKDKLVDHKNGDSLDNRRANLRICTAFQNNTNAKKSKNNTSGYKGVYWDKYNKKWVATLTLNYRQKNLGRFRIKEEAALAYNEAALKYFGEFARLNILYQAVEF